MLKGNAILGSTVLVLGGSQTERERAYLGDMGSEIILVKMSSI